MSLVTGNPVCNARAGKCGEGLAKFSTKPTDLHLRACACVHSALSAAALCNTFAGLHFPLD